MTDLINVPTFLFTQGEPFEDGYEQPILVSYYDGCVEFLQNDNRVMVHPDQLRAFCKKSLKHLPEALEKLNK